MGYESLSLDSKSFLMEAARLSYGANQSDPRKGGAGRMGALLRPDGTARIIKFNTHWTERWFGPSTSEVPGMIESANALRRILVDIAFSAGLSDAEIQTIRTRLGLAGSSTSSDELLDRKAVASVVTMIGGERVWEDALRDPTDSTRQRNMAEYRSDKKAGFRDLMTRDIDVSHNVKSVVRLDRMTVGECKDLFNEARYLHLDSQLDLEGPAVRDGQDVPDAADDNVLTKACRKAFGDDFFSELERGHVLGGQNREKLSKAIGQMFDTLLEQFRAGEFKKTKADELAATIREKCLGILTNDWSNLGLEAGEFGLSAEDIRLLQTCKLMPRDLVKIAPNDMGLDVRERMIVLKSSAVHAAVQLRTLAPGEYQKKANVIRRSVKEGLFVGSFVGALLVESKTVDSKSYLTAVRQDNRNGLGRFGLLDQGKSAKIRSLFTTLRPSFFAGMSDRDAWRLFVKILSRDNFTPLTLDGGSLGRINNKIARTVLNLPHEDVVTLRESKFDLLRFMIDRPDDKPVGGWVDGHLLAEAVRRCQANGTDDLNRRVGDDFDRFWTTVTPERVLGSNVPLTDDEKELFRIIACRHHDAGWATGDAQEESCRHIRETYSLVRGRISTLAGNLATDEKNVIHGLVSWPGNSTQLFKALSTNGLDALFERAQKRAGEIAKLDKDFRKFATKLSVSGLTTKTPTPKVFVGFDGNTFPEFFVLDMFNPQIDTNRLNARTLAFDRYCNLYDETAAAIEKNGETSELRAKKFAADIMRRCLANITAKQLETPQMQDFLFEKVFELCKREDGPITWLDQCMVKLRDPSLTGEAKLQAIKENLWKTTKLFADECWCHRESCGKLYGKPRLDQVGQDEMIAGLSETMQAVLYARQTQDGQTADSVFTATIKAIPDDPHNDLSNFKAYDNFNKNGASQLDISAHEALKCCCMDYIVSKRTQVGEGLTD